MPPSGYDKLQASAISSFLRSCADALNAEAVSKKRNLSNAVRQEISNIEAYKASLESEVTDAQMAVLDLTCSFYQRIDALSVDDNESFYKSVNLIASDIEKEILSIHVDENLDFVD